MDDLLEIRMDLMTQKSRKLFLRSRTYVNSLGSVFLRVEERSQQLGLETQNEFLEQIKDSHMVFWFFVAKIAPTPLFCFSNTIPLLHIGTNCCAIVFVVITIFFHF